MNECSDKDFSRLWRNHTHCKYKQYLVMLKCFFITIMTWKPFRLSNLRTLYVIAFRFACLNFENCSKIENWILMVFKHNFLFFSKHFFFHPNVNQLGFHNQYHLFLDKEWFLRNLEKDFIWTIMHTSVYSFGQSNDMICFYILKLLNYVDPVCELYVAYI